VLVDQNAASVTFVQVVQDATAQWIAKKQLSATTDIVGCTKDIVMEMTTDETEHTVSEKRTLKLLSKVKYVNLVLPVLVAHSILYPLTEHGAGAKPMELALPMLALQAKTDDGLLAGLLLALQPYLAVVHEHLGTTRALFVLTVVADWAKANRLMMRKLLAKVMPQMSIHGRCAMHQVALAFGAAANPLRVASPTFCGSLLMHRGSTQSAFGEALQNYFST